MIPGDENWSLILHQGHELGPGGIARRRIVEEMTSEVLLHLKPLEKETQPAYSEAWFEKGEAFYYGAGVNQSFIEAFECYKIAAKMGHKDALSNLACMAAAGLGIRASPEKAFQLFSLLVYGFDGLGENGGFHWWVASKLNMARSRGLGLGVEKDELGAFAARHSVEKAHACASSVEAYPEICKSRAENFFTFFDIVSPRSSASYPIDDEWFWCLRKIRIVNSEDKFLLSQVLVVEGGDSGLICGDLINRDCFESRSELTEEQGGRPAYGLVFAQGSEKLDHCEFVVGQICGKTARIVSERAWIEPPSLRTRLECMGIGPVVDD